MKPLFSLMLAAVLFWMFTCSPCSADVYDVYLLAGQSNMDGRGEAKDLEPADQESQADAIIYYRNPPFSSGRWVPLTPGYSIPPRYKGDLPSHVFGPEIGFAKSILEGNQERKLALIKSTKGGTSLRKDWNPGEAGDLDSQGDRYRYFVEAVQWGTALLKNGGHKFKIRGLLWLQGESDSKLAAEDYEERFLKFSERVRKDVGIADLPIVVGEVFDNGNRDSVREALHSIGHRPGFGFVSSEGTSTWDPGTHFDAASQLLLGQRYADAIRGMEAAAE